MYKDEILRNILEGNLQNHKNHLSGIYKGYHITLNKFAFHLRVRIAVTHSQPQEIKNLETFLLEQIRTQKHLLSATLDAHVITLNIKAPTFKKSVPDNINSNVDSIITYLKNHGFNSGCMDCGTISDDVSCHELYFEHFYLCNACKNKEK